MMLPQFVVGLVGTYFKVVKVSEFEKVKRNWGIRVVRFIENRSLEPGVVVRFVQSENPGQSRVFFG